MAITRIIVCSVTGNDKSLEERVFEDTAAHVTVVLILVKDLDKCGKQGKLPDWYLGQPLVLAAHSGATVA